MWKSENGCIARRSIVKFRNLIPRDAVMPFRTASPRLTLRLTVAAVVLLTAAGSSASASCGDYVHVLPAGVSAPAEPQPQPPADCPCKHGRCDKAPAPVPPPPTPPGSVGGPTHDAVLDAVAAESQSATGYVRDFGRDLVRRSPSAIFHPPRS
jgi:hypothetical protein